MFTYIRKMLLLPVLLVADIVYAADYTPATVPNPKKAGQEFYVANPDAILADSEVVFLNRCAARLEQETQVELCVVALGSIGDADCFNFTYELFQRWGIGGKNKNTGVLIVFVLDSHDIRIMTGTGIEGVLTDALCADIIRSEMVPAFRAGNYGEGICCGALRIYEVCTDGEAPDELRNMKSVTNRGKYADLDSESEEDSDITTVNIIVWGMVLLFFFITFRAIRAEHPKCPKCGKYKGKKVRDEVLAHVSYKQEGRGIYHYKCEKCGHEWSKPYVVPKLSESSSSSGGSYSSSPWSSSSSSSGGSWGGGSTSGGGAGGKW